MVEIISRAAWGARPPKDDPTHVPPAKRKAVMFHYSTGQELGRENTSEWVREIQKFHQDDRGWDDIGYNFLIDRYGRIFEGRGFTVQGAHCPGHNVSAVGICFLGNDDPGVADLTPAAKAAFRDLTAEVAKRNGEPVVLGHRDGRPTLCPGDEIYAWLKAGMPLEGEPAAVTVPGPAPAPPPPGHPQRLLMLTRPLQRGPDVLAVQQRLLDLGYPLPRYGADGTYGAETEAAVVALQTKAGLRKDGIVGPDTRAALERGVRAHAAPVAPAAPRGHYVPPLPEFPLPAGWYFGPKAGPAHSVSGFYGRVFAGRRDSDWIKAFVDQLIARGWPAGKGRKYLTRFGNDGRYGAELRALVTAFQRDQGLAADGLIGRDTWTAASRNPVT
ncbi:MAG: peptidoglycan-binding domain-containing protein [Actinomycetota bacterium]